MAQELHVMNMPGHACLLGVLVLTVRAIECFKV